jgi:hypothetical protein
LARGNTKKGEVRHRATRDEFHRLLLQAILETTSDPEELASVLESFGGWPLRLPMQGEWPGKAPALPFASLCAVTPGTLRPIWARSLRVFAAQGRAGLVRELAAYAPLVRHTGGTDAAHRLAQELMALPRWWP